MPSTGREGAVDVSGGWYDAGDYGKYVVNAGVTLGTLQLARQWYPDAVGDDLGIPETGNGTSDLGDEIAWELAWLAKMQDPTDGGAFFKVGSPKWDGFVPPSQTKYERVVFGKSTTSTLHFAAVMAQAATSGIADAATSGTWLRQARRAWDWAIAHPAVSHPTEESGTGPYDDTNYDDEFLWAAAELALATDEPAYWEQVRSRMAEVPAESPPQWQNVAALAWLDLAVSARPVPQDVRSEAQRGVLELAQRGLDSEARSPYRLPLDRFFWGSTSDQLNWGVVFAAAHRLSGEARWRDAACQTADYVLGRNAVGRSFVTGFGQRPPRHLHHRVILGSRYSEPFQGLLVGGPNAGIEDDVRKDPTGVLYPDVPPARQYMDHRDAAGTNEICINWNAPLVLVLSFLEATSP
jgi:endoglucanase